MHKVVSEIMMCALSAPMDLQLTAEQVMYRRGKSCGHVEPSQRVTSKAVKQLLCTSHDSAQIVAAQDAEGMSCGLQRYCVRP